MRHGRRVAGEKVVEDEALSVERRQDILTDVGLIFCLLFEKDVHW